MATSPRRIELTRLAYPWIAFFSPIHNRTYYVNGSSEKVQWEDPPEADNDSRRSFINHSLPYPYIAFKSRQKPNGFYYVNALTKSAPVWAHTKPKFEAKEPPEPPSDPPPITSRSDLPGSSAHPSSSKEKIDKIDVARDDNRRRIAPVTPLFTTDSSYREKRKPTDRGKADRNWLKPRKKNATESEQSYPKREEATRKEKNDRSGSSSSAKSPMYSKRSTPRKSPDVRPEKSNTRIPLDHLLPQCSSYSDTTRSCPKTNFSERSVGYVETPHPCPSEKRLERPSSTLSPKEQDAEPMDIDDYEEMQQLRNEDIGTVYESTASKSSQSNGSSLFESSIIVICDTSAIIQDSSLLKYCVKRGIHIVIPNIVQRELDRLKVSTKTSLKNAAQIANRELREFTSVLDSNFTDSVVLESPQNHMEMISGFDVKINDDYILKCALRMGRGVAATDYSVRIILLTMDNNLAMRANSFPEIISASLKNFYDVTRDFRATAVVSKEIASTSSSSMPTSQRKRRGDNEDYSHPSKKVETTAPSSSDHYRYNIPVVEEIQKVRVQDQRESRSERSVDIFKTVMGQMVDKLLGNWRNLGLSRDVRSSSKMRLDDLRRKSARLSENFGVRQFTELMASFHKSFKFLEGDSSHLSNLGRPQTLFDNINNDEPEVFNLLSKLAYDPEFECTE